VALDPSIGPQKFTQAYLNPSTNKPEYVNGQDGGVKSLGYAWQPSTLSFVALSLDASGNLQVAGVGGGGSVTVSNFPAVQTTDDYQLSFRFDGASNPILYVGEAVTGAATSAAAWRIKKINTSGGVSFTWANGSSAFSNIWDNRASLTYS
jgi:hypothetical protein